MGVIGVRQLQQIESSMKVTMDISENYNWLNLKEIHSSMTVNNELKYKLAYESYKLKDARKTANWHWLSTGWMDRTVSFYDY